MNYFLFVTCLNYRVHKSIDNSLVCSNTISKFSFLADIPHNTCSIPANCDVFKSFFFLLQFRNLLISYVCLYIKKKVKIDNAKNEKKQAWYTTRPVKNASSGRFTGLDLDRVHRWLFVVRFVFIGLLTFTKYFLKRSKKKGLLNFTKKLINVWLTRAYTLVMTYFYFFWKKKCFFSNSN